MNDPKPASQFSIKTTADEKEVQNKSVQSADNNESDEEEKNPGATLGLIMGVYPAILIAGILLSIGIISIGNAFRSLPEKRETATPAATSQKKLDPENLSSD
jgi:hypothetical protein